MARTKEVKTDFETKLADLEKKYGLGRPSLNDLIIVTTGSIQLDRAMHIGGTALGKIYEVFGEESCLSGDTFIICYTEKNGKTVNTKGGTIERLWEKFNKQPHRIKQGVHLIDYNVDYYIASKGVDDIIMKNKVLDIVKTGIKPVFEVLTSKGYKIKATLDHKFCTPSGYLKLGDINIGDEVLVHSNKRIKGRKAYEWRKDVMIKNHPTNRTKVIKDRLTGVLYTYKRIQLSRLYYEAYLNGFEVSDWRDILNTDGIDLSSRHFVFIPEGYHIHHEDENYLNNSIENLKLIDPSTHSKLHATERLKNLSFVADSDIVLSITPMGEEETYDIKCAYPFNNFVANKFIVHNSGKSTIVLHQVSEYQKAFPEKRVLILDYEHSFDKKYALAIGVDISKLLFYQPDTLEQGYDFLLDCLKENLISCAVIDSQTAASPKAILEGTMDDSTIGLQARLNSKFCLKIKGQLSIHGASLFIVSQTRDSIGGMGNPVITTGGKAIRFYSDARWKVWKLNDKEHELNKTTIDVIKSKVGNPWGQAKVNILYGKGFDKLGEIIDYAVDFNIIKRAGSWYSYEGSSIGQGMDKVKDLLDDNPDLLLEIHQKVLDNLNNVPVEEEIVVGMDIEELFNKANEEL